eukprot:6189414-Pleurochrysis_carterae.AAC.1
MPACMHASVGMLVCIYGHARAHARLLLELAHILELSRARNNTRADGAAQREQRLAHLQNVCVRL